MKQIFISYSKKHDLKSASKLYSELLKHEKEFKPWIDQKDLLPGIKWKPEIRKAIRESDYFLALLSNNSTEGEGFRNYEINEALEVLKEFPDNKIYLIPIRLNDCTVPFEELNQLNFLDMFPKWNDGINKLLNALGTKRKTNTSDRKESSPLKIYHYRVGLVDIDTGIPNLQNIATSLNKIQDFFLFTYPQMPKLKKTTEVFEDIKNFSL